MKNILNLIKIKINILELGSFYGNATAAMFFYFKNANIYGADINPDMFKYSSERIKSLYVNSSSRDSIYNNLIKKILNIVLLLKTQVICLKIKYYRCSCF